MPHLQEMAFTLISSRHDHLLDLHFYYALIAFSVVQRTVAVKTGSEPSVISRSKHDEVPQQLLRGGITSIPAVGHGEVMLPKILLQPGDLVSPAANGISAG